MATATAAAVAVAVAAAAVASMPTMEEVEAMTTRHGLRLAAQAVRSRGTSARRTRRRVGGVTAKWPRGIGNRVGGKGQLTGQLIAVVGGVACTAGSPRESRRGDVRR